MYQAGGTIKSLLDKVTAQEYILPAIQREFVWKPQQICQLFDSLLKGFPFGTFLFWKIQPQNHSQYQFYDFIQHYHQRDGNHCERLEQLPAREFVAVLDGQQRITSLNIGLRGSYSHKVAGRWWANDDAFPQRKLYLNLLGKPDEEPNSDYQFEFLTEEKASVINEQTFFFRVGLIIEKDMDDLYDELEDQIDDKEARKKARSTLRLLFRTIHDQDKISYYEETNQSLEQVLNIFIRMNSGGTPLSYSDLLLSIAVAQWEQLDAREEIHCLVDEMNAEGDGFSFSKDLVLKAGLMLSDIGSIGFKVENFNKDNMRKLEANWPEGIRSALLLTTRLLASFGFNSQNLKADSAILPIAYYIYFRNLNESYLSRSEFAQDREALRSWFIRSLLKPSGIWGSSLDGLLSGLRNAIKAKGQDSFPVAAIEAEMASRGKSLRFDAEEIEQLLNIQYGDKRTFALLSIVFPGHNFSHHFHVDHIYPKSRFTKTKLLKSGIADAEVNLLLEKSNRLANLQLLEGSINNEKRQKMPHQWCETMWPDPIAREGYLQMQAITVLPETIEDFNQFYDSRRQTLESRICQVLKFEPSQQSDIETWPEREFLEKLELNFSLLNDSETKLVEKASKALKLDDKGFLKVAQLILDWAPKQTKGIINGEPITDVLAPLVAQIHQELKFVVDKTDEEIVEYLVTARLLRLDRDIALSCQQVDSVLSADLDHFFARTDERTAHIVRSRFGMDGHQQQTLEEIGKHFELTRERIRQVGAKAFLNIQQSLSLMSPVIWRNVKEHLTHKFVELYPVLAQRFSDNDGLFQFMALITNTDKAELQSLVFPNYNMSVLQDWFAHNAAPMPKSVAVELLSEQFGCFERQATNALYEAREQGSIVIEPTGIYPQTLKKPIAVAHAALTFEQGAPFREIHQLANQQNLCSTSFPINRAEHGIQDAVNNGLIYLCGHGTYRHTKFFGLTNPEVEQTLALTLARLKESDSASLHLKMDVYQKYEALQQLDYYDVRHVIREYGEREGLFFAGKAGAETVSLDSEVTPKGQLAVILEWFQNDSKPKTREDIAKEIRSGSVNHASFYINELINQGAVVRIDNSHYTTPENAFNGAPIEQIMDIADQVLKQAMRPVEVGIITDKCNTRLHLDKPKAWYVSLLRNQSRLNNKGWHFYHNLTSIMPINEISLHSVIRDLLPHASDNAQLLEGVKRHILASKQAVMNALNSVKTQQIKTAQSI